MVYYQLVGGELRYFEVFGGFYWFKNKKIKLTNHKDTWIDTFTKDKFLKKQKKKPDGIDSGQRFTKDKIFNLQKTFLDTKELKHLAYDFDNFKKYKRQVY